MATFNNGGKNPLQGVIDGFNSKKILYIGNIGNYQYDKNMNK